MPRKARDERLDTRSARLRLTPRREPYWRTIQEGRAIGYRRAAGGRAGTWIARHYDPADRRRYEALGSADDMLHADGARTLSFSQAQDKAREWFRLVERGAGRTVEPLTVRRAVNTYIEDYIERGGKSLPDLRRTIEAHIMPPFGDALVTELTYRAVQAWHKKLAVAPARLRTKSPVLERNVRVAHSDEDRRARRSTANRILTVFKAALSLAYREGRVPADDAWRRAKPFAKVDVPRVRYLADPEIVRLVNACPADLRRLVASALLTGCRYGELTALRAGDFDGAAAVLHIRQPKAGRPRAVPLTDEAARFFAREAAGKPRAASILVRDDGNVWGKSHQFRPLRDACAAAKIMPAVSFHILRHTFASRLAMRKVPMSVIAAALGNTEAVCARHYAHLAPSYVADTIRQFAGGMGIELPDVNVTEFSPSVTGLRTDR